MAVRGGVHERTKFGWRPLKDQPHHLAVVREFPAITPVPYRLPELIEINTDFPVLIAGGEKDVNNLYAVGLTATCNHGGEAKWWPELTQHFTDRRCFILCDNDETGEKPHGGDVSDVIEQLRKDGLDKEAIRKALSERFRAAPAWEPAAADIATTAVD